MDDKVELMECPFCAEKINVRAKKCCHCGEIVDPVLRMLENQNKQVNLSFTGNNPEIQTQARHRTSFILLGVFFGGLGVHNFYAGYQGRGLSQLLITLFLGWLIIPLIAVCIWILVEICCVTKDADGKKFI